MQTHVFRLHPGDDLKKSLINFAVQNNIKAGVIVTCVGSLSKAILRLADKLEVKTFSHSYEIISLVGTISSNRTHLHISLSDLHGQTVGGHLMGGCIIHTTAEIVIGEIEHIEFYKESDEQTGFDELGIKNI